jgi:predicted  nucleic acid-binding Zn-ribbon protein
MLANDAKLALISTERDRLATEKQQLTEAALKSSEELEYMQHENREISTKLVALESIRAQHLSELEELRGDLDIEEVARKEATSRAEAALSDLTRIESTSNLQIESLKEDITRLRGEMESQRIAGKQALSDMEQKLVEAQAQIEQVESSNTEAIMEIAKLRSRQTKPQHVVQPPTRAGGGRVAPVSIDSDIAEVRPMGSNDADARARRLEEELAEANSRLRATSSGVVWSARREPETKEGFIGRLKGTIRRNGDS